MTDTETRTALDPTVSAVLSCPILVILLMPLTIGIGFDVFDGLGELPFALALCAPLALVLSQVFSPRSAARLAALLPPRAELDRPGGLNYAPARQVLMPQAPR